VKPVIIRPEAESDMITAYNWYERCRPGLGEDFLLAVEATLASIERYPEAFSTVHKEIRRTLLRRFPYGVFYIEGQKQCSVIAVFHASRSPHLWKTRGKLAK